MAEPTDRRSMRSRKPAVHFDDKIAQSLAPKKPAKPTKPAKPGQKFRRALYTALLDYSQKKRPWTEAGPHCWVDLPKRQACAMCSKKEKLKKQLAIYQERAGIEVFKANSKRPTAVSSSCGYCDVPLCKTTNCFKEWHAQKG